MMSLHPLENQAGEPDEVRRLDQGARRLRTRHNETEVVWREWGHGRTLVLLHGGAGSWRHWVRNIEVLAEHFRVLTPDAPGLGESDIPPGPWSPEVSSKILARGLDQLLPEDVDFDLVGFSAGSILAGLVAETMKNRCRRLVLVGASALGTTRHPIVLEKIRAKQGEARRLAHFTNLSRLMIAEPDKIDELALAIQDWNGAHARVNSVGFAETALLRDALKNTTAELSAIWGAEDAPARGSLSDRCDVLCALKPDVKISIIPGAGHWVAYEAPTAFNQALLAMLS